MWSSDGVDRIVCLHSSDSAYKRLRLEMPGPYTQRVRSGDETNRSPCYMYIHLYISCEPLTFALESKGTCTTCGERIPRGLYRRSDTRINNCCGRMSYKYLFSVKASDKKFSEMVFKAP